MRILEAVTKAFKIVKLMDDCMYLREVKSDNVNVTFVRADDKQMIFFSLLFQVLQGSRESLEEVTKAHKNISKKIVTGISHVCLFCVLCFGIVFRIC